VPEIVNGAFSVSAMVEADALEVTGEFKEWRRVAASGNTSAAKLCPTCGNHIYHFNPDKPEHLMLKPSTLADTSIINPTIHVWVSEKQNWYRIPDGVQVFETQP
jgi:hypothetical protein